MGKLRVFHEELMEEEGIKLTDLPDELQRKIRGFSLMRKKLEKNPDDEKLFVQLQKNATNLGDKVQDFIESDYDSDDDDDDSKEGKSKSDNDKKSAKKDGDSDDSDDDDDDSKEGKSKSDNDKKSAKKDDEQVEKTVKKPSGKFGNLMMEKKILAIMEARKENRIKISDLEAIIGREPNYPEQEVNNIKLRKVFLSNDYRLM
jgi:cobalamin biosynthesis protein CobT